jgi:hypothetical protein
MGVGLPPRAHRRRAGEVCAHPPVEHRRREDGVLPEGVHDDAHAAKKLDVSREDLDAAACSLEAILSEGTE